MEIVAYDENQKEVANVENVLLDELLKTSDAVFVTCGLNDISNDLLNEDKLRLMKKSAILLSTTWGVVNIEAVTRILKNNQIFGAGFDVSIEGGDIDLPKEFIELENVVLTPHIGYNTAEARMRQGDICISNIEKYLKGAPENVVN